MKVQEDHCVCGDTFKQQLLGVSVWNDSVSPMFPLHRICQDDDQQVNWALVDDQ